MSKNLLLLFMFVLSSLLKAKRLEELEEVTENRLQVQPEIVVIQVARGARGVGERRLRMPRANADRGLIEVPDGQPLFRPPHVRQPRRRQFPILQSETLELKRSRSL